MIEKILNKDVIVTGITIIVIIILYFILKRVIKRVLNLRKIDDRKRSTFISIFTNILKYFMIVLCGIIILDAFGVDTKAIIASLGVVGVVVGLAFQDILKDTISGIFIILENQYAVGDHVTIDGFSGKVVSLGLKSTKILSYNGEIKTIPNRYVEQTINHSIEPPILNLEIPIPTSYDVEKTKKLLNDVCQNLAQEMEEIRGDINVVGITSVTNLYTRYRIRAEIDFLTKLKVQDAIYSEVRKALDKHKDELSTKKEG
ncbi:MAG: mechanosensitive ion channel [Mollicutes bacterium]|nr:mechanosensitive ion channel [Mollicutes bacterium]